MNDRMLDEYNYVKKVVASCVTPEQIKVSKDWAEDWAQRMKRNFPKEVSSWTDLYLSVIAV